MSGKKMSYVYEEDCFYREKKALFSSKLFLDSALLERKLNEIKESLEYLDLKLPDGCKLSFELGIGEEGQKYSARIELIITEQCREDWEQLVTRYGSTEQFIQRIIKIQKIRLEALIKKIRKELEKDYSIDVNVMGASRVHRVHGDYNSLRCDCMAYRNYGICHHIELVKTLKKENILERVTQPIRAPPVFWIAGEGVSEFDREQYAIFVPLKDSDPERTISLLYHLGYGLESLRDMKIVTRNFKFTDLEKLLEEELFSAKEKAEIES